MSKSVLTLDEINLLKYSEEPKNQQIYGNLYKVLTEADLHKAVSLEQLPFLNELGMASITYNKSNLIDTVKQEWYVKSVTQEDPKKKVRCGLCNTANKYLYFITNKVNGNTLNVGSSCMQKFPGIEGYVESQKQMKNAINNGKIATRRYEFHNKFGNVDSYLKEAENFFSSLPILIPYDLYKKLEEVIQRMNLIYAQYVNHNKTPFKSKMNSLDLFKLAKDNFVELKHEVSNFVANNLNNTLACKRKEIDWMLSNNKNSLLEEIARNNGTYKLNTICQVYSDDFMSSNKSCFTKKNRSVHFNIIKLDNDNHRIFFSTTKALDYNPPIILYTTYINFMKNIGGQSFLDQDYTFSSNEIIDHTEMLNSKQNMYAILNYTSDMIYYIGYVFLFDEDRDKLFLYRKCDDAIKEFDIKSFMKNFKRYLLCDDNEMERFLRLVVKKDTNWISKHNQVKSGTSDIIASMYYEQSASLSRPKRRGSNKQTPITIYNFCKIAEGFSLETSKPQIENLQISKFIMNQADVDIVDFAIRIDDDAALNKHFDSNILLVNKTKKLVRDGIGIFKENNVFTFLKYKVNKNDGKVYTAPLTSNNDNDFQPFKISIYGKVVGHLRI